MLRSMKVGAQIAMLALVAGAAAVAQPAPVSTAHTTLVIFADHPMPPGEWAALLSALRTNLDKGGKELEALDPDAEFVRGDELRSSLEVHSAITVYLHGDCSLQPMGRRTAYGVPLGWVRRVDGQIEPFAHVDCTHIAEVIAGRARWFGNQRRASVMAGAMARVILHEWIHIATQNRGHAENGIAKAHFGIDDLMGDEAHLSWSGAGQ